MVNTVTWRPRTYVRSKEIARTDSSFAHLFTLVWMIGVIFLDKTFAYIHIGPIYITEITLGVMILARLRDIRTSDVFLGAVFLFYVAGGLIKGRDLFFSLKDMSWLYYLFFLRFFPRGFPDKYIDVIIYACWTKIAIIFCYPILEGPGQYLIHKYRDSAIVLFLATYYALKNERGRISIGLFGILLAASYFSDYKALMLCMVFFPLALNFGKIAVRLNRSSIIGGGLVILFLVIYFGGSSWILSTSINFLNVLLSIVGVNSVYSEGTAIWRAEIWTRSLNLLDGITGLLFGEFPGHNFVNTKYLGVKFFLTGGDGLGVLRSAHNILVQMVMKAGLLGVFVFVWYYVKSGARNIGVLNILRFFALILAMTADIFEVPSRGPLFYCFFVIIEIVAERRGYSLDNVDPYSIKNMKKNRPYDDLTGKHGAANVWRDEKKIAS